MDVGGWLRSLGLGQYEANFRDNKIDADVLAQLTADDLKDIGDEPVEQRGLPIEVASAILVAQGCVMSILKQAEPEQRSEDSCLHRH